MKYFEQLKDPRWQKKRLEILQRDEFRCTICDDKESTLHVHHHVYFRNMLLWDYPNKYLSTLCDSCHETTHNEMDLLNSHIGKFSLEYLPIYRKVISIIA